MIFQKRVAPDYPETLRATPAENTKRASEAEIAESSLRTLQRPSNTRGR